MRPWGAGASAALLALLTACGERVITLDPGAGGGILLQLGAGDRVTARAVPPDAPLSLDDGPLDLLVLGYDAPPLITAGEDGAIALASSEAPDRWPLPPPDRVLAYRGPDGEVERRTGPLEPRAAALTMPRPACPAVAGYEVVRFPVDAPRGRAEGVLLEPDRGAVLVQRGTEPATVYVVPRRGVVTRAARTVTLSSSASAASVTVGRASILLIGEVDRTLAYPVDASGELGEATVVMGAADLRTLHVLEDGTWLAASSSPPALLQRAPGAPTWTVTASRAHPDPEFRDRCRREDARPQLSIDPDGTVWTSVIGLGLVHLDPRAPAPWPAAEPLPEPGPHCEARRVRLDGGAELVFVSTLDRNGDRRGRAYGRPRRDAPWVPFESPLPLRVFEEDGRVVTVSSNALLELIEAEPRRPDVPPRRCLQPALISTGSSALRGTLFTVGEGDTAAGEPGVRAQWVTLTGP